MKSAQRNSLSDLDCGIPLDKYDAELNFGGKGQKKTPTAVVCLLPCSDNPAPKSAVESVKCSWPDIFNMALVLNGQMNAEMRHVALANAPERP